VTISNLFPLQLTAAMNNSEHVTYAGTLCSTHFSRLSALSFGRGWNWDST